MRLGLLVILIGVAFLLKNLGLVSPIEWTVIWPLVVIYIGISMVARGRCWHCKVWHDGLHVKGDACVGDCCKK